MLRALLHPAGIVLVKIGEAVKAFAGSGTDVDDRRDNATAEPAKPVDDARAQENAAYIASLEKQVEHVRDTAKWIITVFTALAGVLIAGTQLSTMGALSEWSGRFNVAVATGAVALLAMFAVIWAALRVLITETKSLAELVKGDSSNPNRRSKPVQYIYSVDLLNTGENLTTFKEAGVRFEDKRDKARAAGDDEAVAAWNRRIVYHNRRLQQFKAVMRLWTVKQAMTVSQYVMILGGFVGAVAIGGFAWAANPPSVPENPNLFLTPVEAIVELGDDDQARLASILGDVCVAGPFAAVVLEVSEEKATIVSVPTETCSAAKLTISTGSNTLRPADRVSLPATASPTNG